MADCTRARIGWRCTRKGGHPPPCALTPRRWNWRPRLTWWWYGLG